MLAPPSEETLDRMISSLNADFGLELRNDHALLSPSKRRSLLRTEEEGRVDLLYRKIRFLHYNGGDRLTACLGRFRMAAGRLLAQSTGRSHAAASISYKDQELLSDILKLHSPDRLHEDVARPKRVLVRRQWPSIFYLAQTAKFRP
ncbi:hypothetical protein CDD83_6983 [Cordyceps sp. RAO-2017]|nr:hypothetical protein CDD83_6983 [Cordyceps sp. RAO-2017]